MTDVDTWNAPQAPLDEASYGKMMESLDQYLDRQDLHIFQRPLNAARLLVMAYGTTERVQMIPAPRMEDHPKYSAEYLVARVHSWYADRYGDAVKIRPEIGFFVLQLSHRAWKVRLPFFYGTANVYLSRLVGQNPKGNVISRGPIPINILDCFEGMTQPYASALADDELDLIGERFKTAFDALNLLNALDRGNPFHHQARVDYNHSVDALCSVERAYGKARRDTATCAEKVMKGLLADKSASFQPTHNLAELARLLNSECGLILDMKLVERLHTSASVSYDKVVSKQEALDAHATLLRFLAGLANQITQ